MKELYAALSKAQGEFKSIPKNKEVVKTGVSKTGKSFQYSYRYADLDSIIASVRPILAKHGLLVTQGISQDERNCCITSIGHESGQTLLSSCPILLDPTDMQKLGGAITYAKRYGLSLALGISTDDDLDANDLKNEVCDIKSLSNEKDKYETKPPASYTPNKYPLSEKQVKRLYAIASNSSWPAKHQDAYLLATYNKKAGDLSRDQYEKACDFFNSNECTEDFKKMFSDHSVERTSAVEQMEKIKKSGSSYQQPQPDSGFDGLEEIPF